MTIIRVGICSNGCHVIYAYPTGDGSYVAVVVGPDGYTVDLWE